MIFPIAFITVCCFVIGVALLYSGYMSIPRGGGASSEDLQKTSGDLKMAQDEAAQLRQQLADLNKQHEEIKGKLSWAEENVKALEEMQNQASQEPKKDDSAEKDLLFLQQKADALARESIEVINRLAAENEQLQAQLAKPSVNPEELTKLTDENQKFKIQVDGYVNKVKELEARLAVPAVNPAEEELKKLREQSEEKISQANGALTKLYQDIEDLKQQMSARDEKIKTLTSEKLAGPSPEVLAVWEKEKAELSARMAELNNLNTQLKEKEKILSLKLVQSRAQILGLEKMCEQVPS